MTEKRLEEARTYASQSLEMARESDAHKHMARAQRLQGRVLAALHRPDEAARALDGSVRLAQSLRTPREIWMGKLALGKVLAQLGREKEAEAQIVEAAQTIEAIADKLRTPDLRRSFLGGEPVLEVYRTLGRRPPPATP